MPPSGAFERRLCGSQLAPRGRVRPSLFLIDGCASAAHRPASERETISSLEPPPRLADFKPEIGSSGAACDCVCLPQRVPVANRPSLSLEATAKANNHFGAQATKLDARLGSLESMGHRASRADLAVRLNPQLQARSAGMELAQANLGACAKVGPKGPRCGSSRSRA